jgi:two-component system, OmpR family, response regulator
MSRWGNRVGVLIIGDGGPAGTSVQADLRRIGYRVDHVCNGDAASVRLTTQTYDAVILEPGSSGVGAVDLLRIVRHVAASVAVIVLASRDSMESRIRALNEGADDHLTRPFDIQELDARLRAVLRRRGGSALPVLSNGVFTLDSTTYEVASKDGTTRLSVREFALLHALMMRPGTILSRAELEDQIYGWDEEIESNAVEFLIYSIRKKLGASSIKNVRGAGWRVSSQT